MVRLKLGILGGTFDPPHLGHLLLAEFAQHALGLSQIVFVPAGDPPHKDGTRSSAAHRLAMLQLAIASTPGWSVSRVDLDRPGPHYSVDMVRLLAQGQPDAELYFIMGGDSYRDLLTWSRPAELLQQCRLVVMQRPNVTIHPDMHAAALPDLASRSIFIDAPLIGVSSTELVRWLRAGAPIERLLMPSIHAYIQTHGLYA
jgi:nicotinate-nucleotide adenylyltransferase